MLYATSTASLTVEGRDAYQPVAPPKSKEWTPIKCDLNLINTARFDKGLIIYT